MNHQGAPRSSSSSPFHSLHSDKRRHSRISTFASLVITRRFAITLNSPLSNFGRPTRLNGAKI